LAQKCERQCACCSNTFYFPCTTFNCHKNGAWTPQVCAAASSRSFHLALDQDSTYWKPNKRDSLASLDDDMPY